jgi:hypothetical protein
MVNSHRYVMAVALGIDRAVRSGSPVRRSIALRVG